MSAKDLIDKIIESNSRVNWLEGKIEQIESSIRESDLKVADSEKEKSSFLEDKEKASKVVERQSQKIQEIKNQIDNLTSLLEKFSIELKEAEKSYNYFSDESLNEIEIKIKSRVEYKNKLDNEKNNLITEKEDKLAEIEVIQAQLRELGYEFRLTSPSNPTVTYL